MHHNAGNRRPKPLAADVRAALKKGKPFNPGITVEGQHCYIMVPTSNKGLKKQYLGRSLEQHRFALGCDCEGGALLL